MRPGPPLLSRTSLYDRLPALLRAVMSSHDGDAMTLRGRMERLSVLCTDDLTVTYPHLLWAGTATAIQKPSRPSTTTRHTPCCCVTSDPRQIWLVNWFELWVVGLMTMGRRRHCYWSFRRTLLSDALETLDELASQPLTAMSSCPSLARRHHHHGVLPPTTETDEGVLVADTRPAEQSDLDSTPVRRSWRVRHPGKRWRSHPVTASPLTARSLLRCLARLSAMVRFRRGSPSLPRRVHPGNSNWQDRRMVSYVSSTSSRSAGSWTKADPATSSRPPSESLSSGRRTGPRATVAVRRQKESTSSRGTPRDRPSIEVKGPSGHWGAMASTPQPHSCSATVNSAISTGCMWSRTSTARRPDPHDPQSSQPHRPVCLRPRGGMQSAEAADQYRCEGSADATDLNAPEEWPQVLACPPDQTRAVELRQISSTRSGLRTEPGRRTSRLTSWRPTTRTSSGPPWRW